MGEEEFEVGMEGHLSMCRYGDGPCTDDGNILHIKRSISVKVNEFIDVFSEMFPGHPGQHEEEEGVIVSL